MSAYGRSACQAYCLLVGLGLVAAGLIGFAYNSAFSSDPADRDAVLGVLDVNGWHNLVHLATGIVSLAVWGSRAAARVWLGVFGMTYVGVSVWGFAIGSGGSILSVIPVNTADNFLHLLLGTSALLVYAFASTRPPPVAQS